LTAMSKRWSTRGQPCARKANADTPGSRQPSKG
jgi:hypothetical protein